jgi:endonuclease/exonuclease/phosphatase family metal-dependent hydrolase
LVVIAGDFDINLPVVTHSAFAHNLRAFMTRHHFVSAYDVRPDHNFVSYCTALRQSCLLDFFFVNSLDAISHVSVFDHSISFSDHFSVVCELSFSTISISESFYRVGVAPTALPRRRWDE